MHLWIRSKASAQWTSRASPSHSSQSTGLVSLAVCVLQQVTRAGKKELAPSHTAEGFLYRPTLPCECKHSFSYLFPTASKTRIKSWWRISLQVNQSNRVQEPTDQAWYSRKETTRPNVPADGNTYTILQYSNLPQPRQKKCLNLIQPLDLPIEIK